MEAPFKNLGLAITFSPTGLALLKEAKRLKNLFNARLHLIHVGKKTTETENQLNSAVQNAELSLNEVRIIWVSGEPGQAIISTSKSAGVDLLLAGALERENIIKYYVGSVARKLMRNAECSVLIIKTSTVNRSGNKKFFVSTDFTEESEYAVKKSFHFALLENADEFVVIRDYRIPGFTSSLIDYSDKEDVEKIKQQWQKEEEDKMKYFLLELNLKGMNVKSYCVYGREGWASGNLARENNADIFTVNVPAKKMRFIDRLFPHEAEFVFEQLPSNLLVVRR